MFHNDKNKIENIYHSPDWSSWTFTLLKISKTPLKNKQSSNLALLFWNHTSTWRGLSPSRLAKASFCFCKTKPKILSKIPKYPWPPWKTSSTELCTYRIESVVNFKAFFENHRLVFGETKLLPRGITVFFVADSSRWSSLEIELEIEIELLSVGLLSLASLPADTRDRAVRRRNSSFFLAIDRRRNSIHVDSFQQRSRLDSASLRVSICMYRSPNQWKERSI